MNTLDDLTRALRDLESEAPSLDHVRHSTDAQLRPRSRTRFVLPLAVAATVAAIAAGSVWVASGHDTTDRTTSTAPAARRPDGTPAPVDLTWRFAVAAVPGYSIVRTSLESDIQGAFVTSSDGKVTGSVSLFRAGVLPKADIAELRKGRAVTIHGTTGWFGDAGGQATLGWQYAPDAWVTVSGDWGRTKAGGVDLAAARGPVLAIAKAVDTRASDAFRISYRTGYLPHGLVVAGADTDTDLDGRPDGQIDLVDNLAGVSENGRSAAPALLIRRTQSALSALDPALVDATGPTVSLRIDGRPAKYNRSAGWLSVDYPGGTHLQLVVDRRHLTRYPKAELIRIARSTEPVGNVTDTSTWIPASQALPK